jgi:hypothetical protein
MSLSKEHSKKLARLRLLLHNLPDSLLFRNANSTAYNFSANEDDVADFGDENSAINRTLEISFGDRSKTNGIVPIKEKGPGIIAVVDVLQKCLTADPGDARLVLWLENLSESAKEVYRTTGKGVSDYEFIVNLGVKTAMKEMVRQLEMYARREGPFTSPPGSDTHSWWRALSESSDANVLAVRPQLLVSDLGSPEISVPCNPCLLCDGQFDGR